MRLSVAENRLKERVVVVEERVQGEVKESSKSHNNTKDQTHWESQSKKRGAGTLRTINSNENEK